ncbi:MAG: peroxiredoxin, partial [Pseudomonadota bacterium]
GVGFTNLKDDFEKAGAVVVGVSKDSMKSNDKFIEKQGLGIELLSDENSDLCEKFDVWKEKSMYGKTYMGIERSTFIISPEGKITHEWRKVRVPGHVEAVLEAVQNG